MPVVPAAPAAPAGLAAAIGLADTTKNIVARLVAAGVLTPKESTTLTNLAEFADNAADRQPTAQLEIDIARVADYSDVVKALADRPELEPYVETILARVLDGSVAARSRVVGKKEKSPFENSKKRAERAIAIYRAARAAAKSA